MGLKKDFEMTLLVAGAGKLFGDLEAFEGGPNTMSAICNSSTGLVWYVKKSEYERLF